MSINRDIFEELFVLELANNHWGSLERGKRIVADFAKVVRYNNVRSAIKLQLRDVDTFIHDGHRHRTDVRYIKKTLDTRMAHSDLAELSEFIRRSGCIPMATPFDEASVDRCVDLDIPLSEELASSDINDWVLIKKIASTKKPVIASTGGSSLKDVDDLVTFFENRRIPLALNHCVSLYPSEDFELELNQIDFLRDRYPGTTIGFSTHEYHDWSSSIMMAYAKGARTFERHVDIEADGIPVSPYCSLPHQIDEWFQAIPEGQGDVWRTRNQQANHRRSERPTTWMAWYGESTQRGICPAGKRIGHGDFVLAVPLLKGQLSCRELIAGEELKRSVSAGAPLTIDDLDNPYSRTAALRESILKRGLDPE